MGVFPEVERAWLTIDSDIYVWKYEDGGDLAYYDGLTGINANERVSKTHARNTFARGVILSLDSP